MMHAQVYAWVIEYPVHCVDYPVRHCFIKRERDRDIAYVERRAAELHGIVIDLYDHPASAKLEGTEHGPASA